MLTRKKSVEVKLVDNTLVATFHNSHPELIWTFDLLRNHSFTLAMQGEEGDWELGITSPKGEFYPIAHFPAREDAEEAFAAVQKILMKRRLKGWKRVLLIVISLLFIFIAMILVLTVFYGLKHARMTSLMPQSAPSTVAIPDGVPVPADQVLRPPN